MSKNKWTTDNIPDLSGKTIIVTGGSSGLGFESVKAFANKGADVIIASRTITSMEDARNILLAEDPAAKIKVMELDLGDLDSIRKFSSNFKKDHQRLDILMNNAGVMTVAYEDIQAGKTSQMNTNHFGHFALTGLLMELIKATPDSRVVMTSSLAYKQGKMDFDNLLFETKNGYSPMKAYGRSKLANLLFMQELQQLFESNNIDSLAVAAHPGLSLTNLGRHVDQKIQFKIFGPLLKIIVQSAEMGSLPQIRAAVDTNVKGGEYYGPEGVFEITGYPTLRQTNKGAKNKEDAKRLWDFSEKQTGVIYTF